MRILVDADACPRSVLQVCLSIGREKNVEVWTVASFNHQICSENHVIVGDASQETDIKISNMTRSGDVVVTQDWGLAAVILGKGAGCLSPDGREFRSDRIEFLLEEREMKARWRRSGSRTKGPRKRSARDDIRFQETLVRMLEV